MPRIGRPRELTPQLIAQAAELAKHVHFAETLAALLGISRSTLYDWLKKGSRERRRRDRGSKPRDAETIYCDFSDAIKKALAEAERKQLDIIKDAAEGGTWQAAAWILERSRPQRWSMNRELMQRLKRLVRKFCKKEGIDPDTEESTMVEGNAKCDG